MIQIGNLNVMVDHHYNKKGQRVVKTQVFNKEHKFLAQGTATCSKKDNFCKDTGRKKAFKEAFSKTDVISKQERTAFWKAYQTDMTKNPRW